MKQMVLAFLFVLLSNLCLGISIYPGPQDVTCLTKITNIAKNFQASHPIKEHYYLGGNPLMQFEFGAEIEYQVDKNPKLFNEFMPLDAKKDQWLKLSLNDRVEIAKAIVKDNLGQRNIKIFVHINGSDYDLILDLKGNLEIRTGIFSNYIEFKNHVYDIEKRFGVGSVQLHKSTPNNQKLTGTAGHTVFENDFATLYSLERNYEAAYFKEGPVPGKSLTNPSLGQISEADKQVYLENEALSLIKRNPEFGRFESSRGIYSTVLRSDIYPNGRIGWENRQHHKRLDEAFASFEKDLVELEEHGNFERFKIFAETKILDENTLGSYIYNAQESPMDARNINDLLKRVEDFLIQKYPKVYVKGAPYSQRFIMPLRKWHEHPILETIEPHYREMFKVIIKRAQNRYYTFLKNYSMYGDRDIADDSIKDILDRVGAWAYTLKLSDVFAAYKFQNGQHAAYKIDSKIYPVETVESHLEKKYPIRLQSEAEFMSSKAYEKIMSQSVEVIFSPLSASRTNGHITLRVGKRIYGLENAGAALNSEYKFKYGDVGKRGYIFIVGKEEIEKVQAEIASIYQSVKDHNLPAFDGGSMPHQVRTDDYGRISLETNYHSSPTNMEDIEGEVDYGIDGSPTAIYAENNMKFALKFNETTEEYEMSGYSCSTMATMILDRYFGIHIPGRLGAIKLALSLDHGISLERRPNFIINYTRP